ncbi:winged helix-turn-helix domain-containing protein [Chryseobacterium sp. M5A1_1a]
MDIEKATMLQLQLATLESQGLLNNSSFGTGKNAVMKALEHLGYIQIDTLSIVERAHHHTLWTRVPDYQPGYLEELVEERNVFEYWFHAASYLPMRDFRYALPQMLSVQQNQSHYYNADPKVMQYVLDTIRNEGPKKARDFENESKKTGSWWSWKPTKLALERLFMQGDLMICKRKGMEKTYDIRERVLPENIDLTEPTSLEFAEYLVKTYLRAYGFTTLKQITHLKTGGILKKDVNEILESMLQEKTIQQIDFDGMAPVFIQSDLLERVFDLPVSRVQLLSPFDNSIIHRDRVQQIFNFDFRLECYVPKEKRQYGYFCLPILFGNIFIGRVDCKAHRKTKQFELIHLHIENVNIDTELWMESFIESVKKFADFNGCSSLQLTKVSPAKFTKKVAKALHKLV